MLDFPNIETLSVTHQSRFFQAGFGYSMEKNINLGGLVLDLVNAWGVSGVWTGINSIVRNTQDYQPLLINGKNFGSGRIQSITFDQGNDVRIKRYNATLQVLETGNLFNFTGQFYSGINLANSQYLEDFSENYDFEKKRNGGYSYQHRANIRFSSGVGQLNSIQAARTLAKSLFTGTALGFSFYSGFTRKQGKRFFTEAYNLIDNSCSFNESFDFDANSGNYSVTRTHNFTVEQNGVISVSENAQIRGIENPNFEKAVQALNTETDGAYPRCSGVFAFYAPANSSPLINSPLSKGYSYNLFDNELGYGISFNNDKTNSGSYFWSFNQQFTRNNGVVNVTEDGSVLGRGPNPTLAFENAQTGFNIVNSGLVNRCFAFYANNIGPKPIAMIGQNRSYNKRGAAIGYSASFSDEPFVSGTNGVKRITWQESTEDVLALYNKFNIINNTEIAQYSKTTTEGGKTMSMVLEGEAGVSLATYLSNAQTYLNLNAPVGTSVRIVDCDYVFNPNRNVVEVRGVWIYNQVKGPSIAL